MTSKESKERYDVCVVGAGHAGCEAALSCARLGLETVLFTISIEAIALMPCNPSIGGSSKGHLVRELDALGGEMGANIDRSFIQSRMLNRSKGPAVHSLRAQADKAKYSAMMRRVLFSEPHLTVRQAEVSTLIRDGHSVGGVCTVSGIEYRSKAVILCTGTYLNARCLYGDVVYQTGPSGFMAASHLSADLRKNGIRLRRFKTGTPARVDARSVDFDKMTEQLGDERVVPFSFSTDPESVQREQISCWLTYTNEKTHGIIRRNLDRSPLYTGIIEGVGPRYCPSIEDKVVRFPDKDRHQIFVEPEGEDSGELYLSGMSSSLPEDVQIEMYRTVPGLEHARIVRNAYAIEYDCIDARQLSPGLEFKDIPGLFSAGQLNGSSGYEEAAAQGIVAGLNAAMRIAGREPFVLDRSEAYIGVLIDDLVSKESREPYRMMTSRAEYRLLLRQDNADLRLGERGYEAGLISGEKHRALLKKQSQIEREVERVKETRLGATEKLLNLLSKNESSAVRNGVGLDELIRRPELDYEKLFPVDPHRPDLPADVREQVNIRIKYEGYIKRQERQVRESRRLERMMLPKDLDFAQIRGLRIEAAQKLAEYRPASVGQAARISGVSPADISVLLVYLKQRQGRKMREATV